MTKHEDCIFAAEEDCPLALLHITCEECKEKNLGNIIHQAIDDYTSLGESFEVIFAMLRTLVASISSGKTVDIKIPVIEINIITRVINALLGSLPEVNKDKIVYRRLIFYFFKILIDEFESEEYAEPKLKH